MGLQHLKLTSQLDTPCGQLRSLCQATLHKTWDVLQPRKDLVKTLQSVGKVTKMYFAKRLRTTLRTGLTLKVLFRIQQSFVLCYASSSLWFRDGSHCLGFTCQKGFVTFELAGVDQVIGCPEACSVVPVGILFPLKVPVAFRFPCGKPAVTVSCYRV